MATYRIITSKKTNEDESEVRSFIENEYPEWDVENLVEVDGEWQARLVHQADVPPFLKEKKDEEGSPEEEASESPEEEDEEDSGKDEDEGKSEDDKDKGEKKKGDPVAEIQKVIDDLTGLLGELGGKTKELQDAHQEKQDKLDQISETVGDGAIPETDGPIPPDLEADGGPVGPGPGKVPPIPKRPGVPSGNPSARPPRPGVPSAFGRRRTEVAYHSGLDESGEKMSLTAAAAQLEAQDEFKDYQVVGIKEENGRFVAKLQLK